MKKILFIISIIAILASVACEKDDNGSAYKNVTVSMEANSASDVYYSLAGGEINTVNRTDWDIAFSSAQQSATVFINEGAGVELYCVGDSNDWESIDENTILSLDPRFNDKSGWTIGAFNRNADPLDIFNFGWGHYNMSDHHVYGDSIHVIKLSNGAYKKLFYRKRDGYTATHYLELADLDGSNEEVRAVVTTSYIGTRNLIHYSVVNQEIVEAEPLLDQWDLLFTRYIIQIPAGPGVIMNYPVMGVLSNTGVTVARITGVPPEEASDSPSSPGFTGYSELADAIGYDWKVSDPVTHEISLVDSMSYFVQSVDGKKYHLYFTSYGGSTAGTTDLKIRTVE
jgi:hypothetical protein